jgi:hypothetical protein
MAYGFYGTTSAEICSDPTPHFYSALEKVSEHSASCQPAQSCLAQAVWPLRSEGAENLRPFLGLETSLRVKTGNGFAAPGGVSEVNNRMDRPHRAAALTSAN